MEHMLIKDYTRLWEYTDTLSELSKSTMLLPLQLCGSVMLDSSKICVCMCVLCRGAYQGEVPVLTDCVVLQHKDCNESFKEEEEAEKINILTHHHALLQSVESHDARAAAGFAKARTSQSGPTHDPCDPGIMASCFNV